MTTDERDVDELDDATVAAADRIQGQAGLGSHALWAQFMAYVAEHGESVADAVAGLRFRRLARAELDDLEVDVIRLAREHGAPWRVIAEALGVNSPQAAQKRFVRLTGEEPPPVGGRTTIGAVQDEIAKTSRASQVAISLEVAELASGLGLRDARRDTRITHAQADLILSQAAPHLDPI